MDTAEILYKMSSRGRQENDFRFGRQRFALDSHDSYASTDDDSERLVPNPAKEKAKLVQQKAWAQRDTIGGAVNASMLAISTPEPGGGGVLIDNALHNDVHAPLVAAQQEVEKAEDAYQSLETRCLWGRCGPASRFWIWR